VGTLSKALGAAGGFVAGHADLVRWLRHAARAWIFSTAHPPAVAAAACRAIELVAAEPERRALLGEKAAFFRDRLAGGGLNAATSGGQIVPIVVGDAEQAVAVAGAVAAEGFFVPAIRPPSVPAGKSLVRTSICWHHTTDDLARLAAALVRHARS
jgi:7-keto-8-aminopelargonate synthetase-like enzyme